MNIIGTQYTLATRSLEIYLAGCNGQPKCPGCHNPESWDFTLGKPYVTKIHEIKIKLQTFDSLIDNIMIMGGEPLDQSYNSLWALLSLLFEFKKKVWLFTRYSFEEIDDDFKMFCDYIKCGRYLQELTTEDNIQYGIKLATSNQLIYKKGLDY